MHKHLVVAALGLCALTTVTTLARHDAPRTATVLVGPNILVSRDGSFPHAELMAAANPKNARNLIGAAITPTRRDGGEATTVYASFDGGYSWTSHAFPLLVQVGGGDPQVAFTAHGTALFASLATVTDDIGRTRAALHAYRSEDGGATWTDKPADLGYSYDHDMLVADQTTGRFAGRVYLGVLYGFPVYRVGVFRSEDDGRSWIGPVEVTNGRGENGINVANMLILSDGTLVTPFVDFEFKPDRRATATSNDLWLSLSQDGGVSFSAPKHIARRVFTKAPLSRFQSFPMFAVDNLSDPFRDRLYCAFGDMRTGRPRILFTYSSDRGTTWSEPKAIGGPSGDTADQFQPSLAVNHDGVVALTWFDTRGSTDGTEFNEYFAASLDAGESFLPPVRASTDGSHALGEGNLAMTPSDFRTADSWRINLLSFESRWGNGGDYMGLTADAKGLFHPFWADSRSGTFQIYTAAVKVVVKGPEETAAGPVRPTTAGAANPAAERVKADLTGKVELVYDPTHYNASTKMLDMPVRLKNTSDRPIYGPLRIEIVKFGSGLTDEGKENAPQVLNATNGKPGDGAVFDYSRALGDFEALEPGMVTSAIVWRLKLVDPLSTPNVHIAVTGVIDE
jgi:hypothetical protein